MTEEIISPTLDEKEKCYFCKKPAEVNLFGRVKICLTHLTQVQNKLAAFDIGSIQTEKDKKKGIQTLMNFSKEELAKQLYAATTGKDK